MKPTPNYPTEKEIGIYPVYFVLCYNTEKEIKA